VDFQRRRVRPLTRFGGRESQEVVGDESAEDVHGDLCGIFPSLLNHLNLWQVVGSDSYTIHSVEARVQLLNELTCVPGRTMDA
jgi:hypothetical protein